MMACENESVVPFFFYKITCREKDDKCCYIGKTKNFCNRVACHKSNSKFSNIKLYQYIREHGGFNNFFIEKIHQCICDEKTSILLELPFINEYRSKGFQMLNSQCPNIYEKQEYNKKKCQEHYMVMVDCECGWSGSKMNHCKHLKTSVKHRKYSLNKIENEIENKLFDMSPIMVVIDGMNAPQFVSVK